MEQADIDSEYFSRGVALGKIIVADDASAMRSWLKNHQKINDKNGVIIDWKSIIMIEDGSIDNTSEVVMCRAMAGCLMENHAYKCLDEILRHPCAGEAILSQDQWYTVNKKTCQLDKAAENHGFLTVMLTLSEYELERWLSASVVGWQDFFKGVARRSILSLGEFAIPNELISVKYGLARIMNGHQCIGGSALVAAYSAEIVSMEGVEWIGGKTPWLFRNTENNYEWVIRRIGEIDAMKESKKLMQGAGIERGQKRCIQGNGVL